jgi:hypothetical protein
MADEPALHALDVEVERDRSAARAATAFSA